MRSSRTSFPKVASTDLGSAASRCTEAAWATAAVNEYTWKLAAGSAFALTSSSNVNRTTWPLPTRATRSSSGAPVALVTPMRRIGTERVSVR
jgi:hypothetical protein